MSGNLSSCYLGTVEGNFLFCMTAFTWFKDTSVVIALFPHLPVFSFMGERLNFSPGSSAVSHMLWLLNLAPALNLPLELPHLESISMKMGDCNQARPSAGPDQMEYWGWSPRLFSLLYMPKMIQGDMWWVLWESCEQSWRSLREKRDTFGLGVLHGGGDICSRYWKIGKVSTGRDGYWRVSCTQVHFG